MSQQDTSQNRPKPLAWLTSDKVFAVLALPSAATFLHYVGREGHRERLHALGVDSGLFDKSMDVLLNAGFHYSINRSTLIVEQMGAAGGVWIMLAIALCAVMVVALGAGLRWVQKKVEGWASSIDDSRVPTWTKTWGLDAVLAATFASSAYVFIWLLVALLTLLMLGASAFGQSAGRAEAKRELAEFRKGCEAAQRVRSCIEVRKGDELVTKGFIIDSNDKHLALYEVDKRRTRTFERTGLDIIGLTSDARTVARSAM